MEWSLRRLVLADAPILRAALRGAVTIEDEIGFVSALEAEAGDARGLLLDFSDADPSALSEDDVIAIADNWKRSRFGNSYPFAAYSTTRAVLPTGRLLLARWDPDTFYVVGTEREAIEWLAKRVRHIGT